VGTHTYEMRYVRICLSALHICAGWVGDLGRGDWGVNKV